MQTIHQSLIFPLQVQTFMPEQEVGNLAKAVKNIPQLTNEELDMLHPMKPWMFEHESLRTPGKRICQIDRITGTKVPVISLLELEGAGDTVLGLALYVYNNSGKLFVSLAGVARWRKQFTGISSYIWSADFRDMSVLEGVE